MGKIILALWILLAPALYAANKTDDALASALAQNKAQALTIAALTKAVAKTNVDAGVRAADATQQREAASTTTAVNAVAAQVAVSDQKETAIRVETKTDAAVAGATAAKSSADEATSAGNRNTMLIALFGALSIIMPAFWKYKSESQARIAATALAAQVSAHQAEVVGKLNKVQTQTDGMTEKIEQLATAAGHAQGDLDARDAGKTGD
jgi:hypothetical protein